MPASLEELLFKLLGPGKEDVTKRLNPSVLAEGTQARADRHNQSLPADVRQSQSNQDWDHYLVGNEMAGPQYPLNERLGAIIPAVGHEVVRPLLAKRDVAPDLENKVYASGGGDGNQLMDLLNRTLSTPDQPIWINKGAGAGGAAAEAPVGIEGALRNLMMLYRGATAGKTPGSK